MIEKYGLFDSLEGDERVYAETDFAILVKALGQDGVRGGMDALKVTPLKSGLGVGIHTGMAIVQGRYYALEDDGSGAKSILLTTSAVNPRIDRVVLCLNTSERTVSLEVLKGTEAAAPVAPTLVRNAAQHMLSLAQVRIGVGAASLSEDDITDERGDEALCGLHTDSAQKAMTKAQAAETAANAARIAAGEARQKAEAAQSTANSSAGDAASALAEAKKRIPSVSGVGAGDIPVFNAGGNLVSSSKRFDDFTLAKMTLSGTTLTITTID